MHGFVNPEPSYTWTCKPSWILGTINLAHHNALYFTWSIHKGWNQCVKSGCGSDPSGRAIHVPQISTWICKGIPGDHPCGNFLMISLWKFRGNEGEFSMWIFPPPFPVESLGIFPHGNFPRASLKNLKCNLLTLEGSQLCENMPLMIWCHFLVN